MTLEEIKKQEEMYVMHTYNRFPIALECGKGAVLWDSEGRFYIDMTSGIGVNSLGHQNKALLAAVNGQRKSCCTPATSTTQSRWYGRPGA